MISNKRNKHAYFLLNFQQTAYFMISNKHNIFNAEFLQALKLKIYLNEFVWIQLDRFIRFIEVKYVYKKKAPFVLFSHSKITFFNLVTPLSRSFSLFCNFTLILDFRVLSQLFVNKGHDRHSFSYLQIEI